MMRKPALIVAILAFTELALAGIIWLEWAVNWH
jgi:hypothetical protein